MELLEILQNIWFLLIGVLFIGYSILDGFDLGLGSLFPLLGKNEEDRKTLLNLIWPFWDGNEVWLLTAGGALFAAFPHAYATVFSGFYLALMLVLLALILRAVSLEFWFYDEKRRGIWEKTFIIGSLLPSLLFGVALGNVIIGIPMNESMDFTGNFFTLLRPYPLALGLLGLAAILLQGGTYTALKADGSIRDRAKGIIGKLWIFHAATLLLALIAAAIFAGDSLKSVPAWIFFTIAAGGAFMAKKMSSAGSDLKAFTMSSVSFLALWGMAGAVHYPNLVKASNGVKSITILNGSSTELTLKVMLIIALVGMPIVIGYTIFVYRVFKGKIGDIHY